MIETKKKIVNLNIKTIRFPITAIASILHRISGILLFIIIGPILWLLKSCLSIKHEHNNINNFIASHNCLFKFFLWAGGLILIYHVVMGVRQMLIDFGFLKSTWILSKISIKISFILIIIFSTINGIILWYPLN